MPAAICVYYCNLLRPKLLVSFVSDTKYELKRILLQINNALTAACKAVKVLSVLFAEIDGAFFQCAWKYRGKKRANFFCFHLADFRHCNLLENLFLLSVSTVHISACQMNNSDKIKMSKAIKSIETGNAISNQRNGNWEPANRRKKNPKKPKAM